MEKISNSRCVGIIDSVSAGEIKAYLIDEAPHNVSISMGTYTLFPRINGFLIVPNETGALVGITTWIGYNHMNLQNDVDLPKGSRMISLTIIGHIENTIGGREFIRGSFSLPTIGDVILLPTDEEIALINKIEGTATVDIGTSPILSNHPVRLPINELFAKHVAVLGNTGSGKSCTVTGLVRWSIEEFIKNYHHSPNARFIILDPNGEYGNAFSNLNMEVLHCSVKDIDELSDQLKVPAWMWTSSEWASVLKASEKVQRPILQEALRDLRSANIIYESGEQPRLLIQRNILNFLNFINVSLVNQSYMAKKEKNSFGIELEKRTSALEAQISSSNSGEYNDVKEFTDYVDSILKNNKKSFTNDQGELIEYYGYFDSEDVDNIKTKLTVLLSSYVGNDKSISEISEDDPVEFEVNMLAPYIESIAQNNASEQYVDFMTVRIRSMLANAVLQPIIGDEEKVTLLDWITKYLGSGNDDKGKICVIDLSLLPTYIVHLIVATISRLIFEALQRYRKVYKNVLPTVLVMDEAHTFIHRLSDSSAGGGSSELCTQIFERIAREGRKYGLGLVLASQRPSELSPTVLSQCNTFILHRIVNDRDQEMVRRLVPDNVGNLLNELPALPTQKAIVLGSAITVPTLVDIYPLAPELRPRSETPDYWKAWQEEHSKIDWKPVVNEWQKYKD